MLPSCATARNVLLSHHPPEQSFVYFPTEAARRVLFRLLASNNTQWGEEGGRGDAKDTSYTTTRWWCWFLLQHRATMHTTHSDSVLEQPKRATWLCCKVGFLTHFSYHDDSDRPELGGCDRHVHPPRPTPQVFLNSVLFGLQRCEIFAHTTATKHNKSRAITTPILSTRPAGAITADTPPPSLGPDAA